MALEKPLGPRTRVRLLAFSRNHSGSLSTLARLRNSQPLINHIAKEMLYGNYRRTLSGSQRLDVGVLFPLLALPSQALSLCEALRP